MIKEEEIFHPGILLDTKGPEIRTGKLKDGKKIALQKGDKLWVGTDYSTLGT